MKKRGIRAAIATWALCLACAAGAQESLDQGKTPAQLFASDCSICHKSPQGLTRAGGILGLDSFLREHYTASKETAAAIAGYLRAMDTAAAARTSKRSAKGDDKKKAGAKPGEEKGTDNKSGAKTAEPKSSEPKSVEPKPPEILAPESKAAPAAGEAKPAEGKPEKSD
jgi:hypothetical protein